MRTRFAGWLLVSLSFLVLVAGCGEDDDDMRTRNNNPAGIAGRIRFFQPAPVILADVTAATNAQVAQVRVPIPDTRLIVHTVVYADAAFTPPPQVTVSDYFEDLRDSVSTNWVVSRTNFLNQPLQTVSGNALSWNISNEGSQAHQVQLVDTSGIAQTYRILLQASLQPSIVEMSDQEWADAVGQFVLQPLNLVKLP